jgi:4'-phosphopantetheinyl transferase
MDSSPDPRIYCLLQSLEDGPGLVSGNPSDDLLSPAERARFDRFIVPKRRRDWLLGRWTAKHLIRSYLALTENSVAPLARIEILADEDGAPHVSLGERQQLSLSISHSGGWGFCAVCRQDVGSVGADIETVEAREASFVRTFFTPGENASVEAAAPAERDALITGLWSAKEAALKALRLGLRADTRRVDVSPGSPACHWSPIAVRVDPSLLPSLSTSITSWQQSGQGYILSLALLHSQ